MHTRRLLRLVTQILCAVALFLSGVMAFTTVVVFDQPVTWFNVGTLLLLASVGFSYFAYRQYRRLYRVLEGQP